MPRFVHAFVAAFCCSSLVAQVEFRPAGKAHLPVDDYLHAVAVDIDGDGDIDLLPWNSETILLNDGNARFSPAAATIPERIGTFAGFGGDFDNDGLIDLFYYEPGLKLLRQVAPLSFVDSGQTLPQPVAFPTGTAYYTSAAGDIDNDGDLDVVFAIPYGVAPGVLINDGTGTLVVRWPPPGSSGSLFRLSDLDLGDFNGDSYLDIVTVTSPDGGPNHTYVLLNDGTGAFPTWVEIDPGDYRITVVDAVDMFRLGALDLVCDAGVGDQRRLLVGRGDGTFVSMSRVFTGGFDVPLGPLAFVDVDGDGRRDLTVGAHAVVPSSSVIATAGEPIVDTAAMPGIDAPFFQSTVADFDGDGDEDLLLSSDVLLLNAGDGRLRLASAALPRAPSVQQVAFYDFGDVDADGDLEALTSEGLWRQSPGGTWHPVEVPELRSMGRSFGARLVDLDRDGILDIFAWRQERQTSVLQVQLVMLRGLGGYRFEDVTDASVPSAFRATEFYFDFEFDLVDFDSDGDLDLVYGSSTQNRVVEYYALRHTGVGMRFSSPELLAIAAAPWIFRVPGLSGLDIDNDGDVDFLSVIGTLLVNEAGSFVDRSSTRLPIGLATYASFADFDGDGHLDLLRFPFGGVPEILLNDGAGLFTNARTLNPLARGSLLVDDLDADGDPDLGIWPLNRNYMVAYLNDGTGSFTETPATTGLEADSLPMTLSPFVDLDDDGDVDFIARGRTITNLARELRAPFVASRGRDYELHVHAPLAEPPAQRLAAAMVSFGQQRIDLGAIGIWHLDPATLIQLPAIEIAPNERSATYRFVIGMNTPIDAPFFVQAAILDPSRGTLRLTGVLTEQIE